MERTRNRPIPTGRITTGSALLISIALIISGFIILLLGHSLPPALLGILAILLYNGVYTPLKALSAYAAVPGALVGAISPAIGWTCGNGSFLHPVNVALMSIFFLWQVPHFWMLLRLHEQDYRNAGFPVPTARISRDAFMKMIASWTFALISSILFLPVFHLANHPALYAVLIVSSIFMALQTLRMVREKDRPGQTFAAINILILVTMMVLITGRFLHRPSLALTCSVRTASHSHFQPDMQGLKTQTKEVFHEDRR